MAIDDHRIDTVVYAETIPRMIHEALTGAGYDVTAVNAPPGGLEPVDDDTSVHVVQGTAQAQEALDTGYRGLSVRYELGPTMYAGEKTFKKMNVTLFVTE